jgi:hypothetical protein
MVTNEDKNSKFCCTMKAKSQKPKKAAKKSIKPTKTPKMVLNTKTKIPAKAVNKDFQKLGNRIKQLRIDKGYTSYEYFAYDHDISRTQFGRYERGEDLRYSSLLRVVKALGITLEKFFSKGF